MTFESTEPTVEAPLFETADAAAPAIPTLDDMYALSAELDEIDQTLAELDR